MDSPERTDVRGYGSRAVGGDKDRTQEQEVEKRSGAGRFTQGREWVGLNLGRPLASRVLV
jgi:hypothetical protein